MEANKPDPNWKVICAKCMDGEIEPADCEYYGEPNGCNSPIYGEHPNSAPVGNSAAMREALKTVKRYLDGYTVNVLEMRSQVDAALAAPPRNCDVGTAEEQCKRFQDFCDDSQVDEDYTSMCARCTLRREKHCELAWAQLPYPYEE